MEQVIIIPARLNSSRLPNKVLLDLKGKTIIQRVFEQCIKVENTEVFIATDSDKVREICLNFTNNVLMTASHHSSGTERIIEAIQNIECDYVVNVQADEPFISPVLIQQLFSSLKSNNNNLMSSVMERINHKEDLYDENIVKVIVNDYNNAIYFSRSMIPFIRDDKDKVFEDDGRVKKEYTFYKHVGVYGYNRSLLLNYSTMKKSKLETLEKLEQLRVIHNGININMILTDERSIGIDTLEDYNKALALI